jgi:hypothetical protein
MRRKRSSGLAVKWSSDRASGFPAGALGHLITEALCLLLVLAACEVSPSEKFTPQLVVHGLVRAGYPWVDVNINRTYAIDEPFDTMFPGASGLVWHGTETWSLENYGRDAYQTRGSGPWPAPGDTFGIRIAKDGFDTVYGQTVVPDSFRILFPHEGDTVTMSDSMVWTRSRNCAGYYMSLRSIEQGDTFYFNLAMPNDTTGDNFDSLVYRCPAKMAFLYLFEPGRQALRVYALDTNYFEYVSAGGFGAGASDTTRLSGGLGVFGSAVGESLEVYYVKGDTTRAAGTAEPEPSRSSVDARTQESGRTDADHVARDRFRSD